MATETFGQRLRRIRTERNISQDQLAEALHTTRQTVSSWENDKSAIDYFALVDLQKILFTSWEELMEDEEVRKTKSSITPVFTTEQGREDYMTEGQKRGFTFVNTDIRNLKAGDYRIELDDISYFCGSRMKTPCIFAMAEEAYENGYMILAVGWTSFTVRLKSEKQANEFKEFIKKSLTERRSYEHLPRFMLIEQKYDDEWRKYLCDMQTTAIRNIFKIDSDEIYVVFNLRGDATDSAALGAVGYAGSIEDAQKLAKKLNLVEYNISRKE